MREQVELYESSSCTKGTTTLRDTGLPAIIVTRIGAAILAMGGLRANQLRQRLGNHASAGVAGALGIEVALVDLGRIHAFETKGLAVELDGVGVPGAGWDQADKPGKDATTHTVTHLI